jgi:hypothetical protein
MRKVIGTISLLVLFCLGGCRPAQPSLTVEEYELTESPFTNPAGFTPVNGTEVSVLAKHAAARRNTFPDTYFSTENRALITVKTKNGDLVAKEISSSGRAEDTQVTVSLDGNPVFSIPTGDAGGLPTLQGLWEVSGHWVLEVVHVNEYQQGSDVIVHELSGQIIEDGEILNQDSNYQTQFGFQLMNGHPFYFFERDNKFGVSFNGQEMTLGYDNVINHYRGDMAALNVTHAKKMVTFFAERGGKWYYVEIGDYE